MLFLFPFSLGSIALVFVGAFVLGNAVLCIIFVV